MGKQAHKNPTSSFPATVRETKSPFRLHASPKFPGPPPCFSERPQEQVALVLVIQKTRFKETDDTFEVTGRKGVPSLPGFCSPITTPHLLIKNLPGEASAFTKLFVFAKCY